jgi:hypothetical protein
VCRSCYLLISQSFNKCLFLSAFGNTAIDSTFASIEIGVFSFFIALCILSILSEVYDFQELLLISCRFLGSNALLSLPDALFAKLTKLKIVYVMLNP